MKHHIAGKPMTLMTGLLEVMEEPILDPLAGPATVACLERGLECTSIEVGATYFDVASKRLQAAINGDWK